MTVSVIIIAGLVLYFLLYFLYGRYLAHKVVEVSEEPTPAVRLYDGVDFVPANKYVLFGHHFASIAGAGPIVGPAIGIAWGWLPALLWVWLGNVVIGAVHDYLSLMSSVRYDGHSVQWIAGRILKKRTGYIFSIFVFFVLVLVVAAFAAVLGKLFVKIPAVPTSYLIKIGGALILGVLLYRMRVGLGIGTLFAAIWLALSIWLGKSLPIKASYHVWMLVFFVYIIVAASIPVHVLLQPRDYMNSLLLVGGLVLGGLAGILSFKSIGIPAFASFAPKLIAGQPTPFWPAVVLIIACGSLSGFHSLVASGTSSKQLSKEEEGLFVGYGSMLAEGFLSTIVVACIGAYGMTLIPKELAAKMTTPSGFAANILAAEKKLGGPAGFFAKSYGATVHNVLHLPRDFMVILASMWIASFAMTTLDTTNRLARYTFAELLEPIENAAPGVYNFFTNRWVASVVPAALGVYLAWSGAWHVVWPAFSGANQMLASIAMLTAAAWVIRVQKKQGAAVLVPALFLWITVSAALIWYVLKAVPVYVGKNPVQGWIIGAVVVIMLLLNLVLIFDYFTSKPEAETLATSEK